MPSDFNKEKPFLLFVRGHGDTVYCIYKTNFSLISQTNMSSAVRYNAESNTITISYSTGGSMSISDAFLELVV